MRVTMRRRTTILEFLPIIILAALTLAAMCFASRPREWQLCEVLGNKLDNCRDATEGDHLDVTLVALGLRPGWAVWRRR